MLTSFKSRRFQAKKWIALWIGCVFLKWGLGELKAYTQNVWYWDNNLGNSIWGGAFTKSQYNWDQNTTPEVVSGYPPIVVFDNSYIKADQKILLQDTDKVVEGIYFMGPYSYSLYTDQTAKKITLDTGSSGNTYAFIANLSNSCGDAKDHLIQTEVDAMSDVLLYNDAQGSLSFSNLFNIDKHNLWAYTLSQINMDSLAGYGSLQKYGSGSLTLSNSSVNFYGNTVLAEGSLSLRHGQGLGGISLVKSLYVMEQV